MKIDDELLWTDLNVLIDRLHIALDHGTNLSPLAIPVRESYDISRSRNLASFDDLKKKRSLRVVKNIK